MNMFDNLPSGGRRDPKSKSIVFNVTESKNLKKDVKKLQNKIKTMNTKLNKLMKYIDNMEKKK